jgi:hypothetical protein
MMKRLSAVAFLLLSFLLLTAMGGKGAGFERAPRVDKNFAVTVTDVSGNKIEGDHFSWEGRTHFAATLGVTDINVPFERVKEITVGEKRAKKVKVTAKLRDGGETVFEIDADSRCYGEASFGSFMLLMEEIQSVVFKNP